MSRRPEILAPAGDRDAIAAALAAGADAIYFGLDEGFNARARAKNIPVAELPEIVAWIHRAGARAYVTFNTLVFEPELPIAAGLLRAVAAAGTDAIIVQDPAVALLARALCPALEVHASTQMTASSPAAATLLAPLGLSRVVVPRELSVDEIRAYAADSPVPLEVFIHGALCVAWSGQCLSSEAWGGRSANRGQCAQACRLPYDLVVDGERRDLGDVAYLLSPKDLVGLDHVRALAEIGVASLKIEGRMKGPAYVATSVNQYRRAVAEAVGDPIVDTPELPVDRASLELAYSRGASPGFLGGADHQRLVEGRAPRHRGLPLGRVTAIDGDWITVAFDPAQQPVTGGRAIGAEPTGAPRRRHTDELEPLVAPSVVPRAGMGVVFDRGRPEEPEQGGPIHEVAFLAPIRGAGDAPATKLRFGNPGPDLTRVAVGDFVWANSDPRLAKAGERAVATGQLPLGRIAISLTCVGVPNMQLRVSARVHLHHASALLAHRDASRLRPEIAVSRVPSRDRSTAFVAQLDRREVVVTSESRLAVARGGGLTTELLVEKLGGLGGTAFHLDGLDTTALAPGLHLPVSELKDMRRELVAQLDAELVRVDRAIDGAASPGSAGARSTAERCEESASPGSAGARSTAERCEESASPGSAGARSTAERCEESIDIRIVERVRREVTPVARSASGRPLDPTATIPDIALPVDVVAPQIIPLCRTDAQLDAMIAAGAPEVELDWMELVGLGKAVVRAKAAGVRVVVAGVRVQKPGEERIDQHLAKLEPDAILVRSWGSLAYHEHRPERQVPLHADFSLNVTSSITAGWVLAHANVESITASHDLDRAQLFAMLAETPRGRVAVTVHHHIPTFHTEHCVYAHLLSTGRDYRTCGRPCEHHAVSLADRVNLVHPVVVDVGCRNTIFNAQAQSAASLVPDLIAAGVRRFRVEFVRETADEARTVYEAYAALAAGTLTPAEVVKRAAVHEQFGVTRGTMRTLTVIR